LVEIGDLELYALMWVKVDPGTSLRSTKLLIKSVKMKYDTILKEVK